MRQRITTLAVLTLVVAVWLYPTRVCGIDCDTLPTRPPILFDSVKVFQFNGGGSDCWGWVSPDGVEYGIYGTDSGVAFINVTDMQVADFVPGVFGHRDMKTYRNYCYAVAGIGTDGVFIIDMSFLPDSVHVVNQLGIVQSSHNLSIDTANGLLYVILASGVGFRVLSLSNPEVPVTVTVFLDGPVHDFVARNDTLWVAEALAHTFAIYDMADKENPVLLARLDVPLDGHAHNIWPSDNGQYMVTTEETRFRTVKIWDMSDMENVHVVDGFLGTNRLAHNVHVEGDYLFVSHYESGVYVLDISVPECPVVMSQFDTYPSGESGQFISCWGVYPHAGTGRVYASTVEGEFWVFQTDIPSAKFYGLPRVGPAPLTVQFGSLAPDYATAISWDFGDGNSSILASPTQVFAAGLYDVGLTITTSVGSATVTIPNYVTALAESLNVDNANWEPGGKWFWEIGMTNNVPITALTLPIALSGVPDLVKLDSISFVGTRTEDFEKHHSAFNNKFLGEMVYQLRADNGGGTPPMPPGSGPVARVYLTINDTASPEDIISLKLVSIAGYTVGAATLTTDFVPVSDSGVLVICACSCLADPVCDKITDVFDVLGAVNVAFQNGSDIPDPLAQCPFVTTDVTCDNVTDVFDVLGVVGVAFQNADPTVAFCDPCP